MFWFDFGASGWENIVNSLVLFLVRTEKPVSYGVLGACLTPFFRLNCEKNIVKYSVFQFHQVYVKTSPGTNRNRLHPGQSLQTPPGTNRYTLLPGSIAGFAKPINMWFIQKNPKISCWGWDPLFPISKGNLMNNILTACTATKESGLSLQEKNATRYASFVCQILLWKTLLYN